MLAWEVLKVIRDRVDGAESLKFILSVEAVKIGFVEEEKMMLALEKELMVRGVWMGITRCLRWDLCAIRLVVEGVQPWGDKR